MKKCASCTKDLPDAALHCVFCGAKQPPAPATAAGAAKTVMGSYSAGDMIAQLRAQPGGIPGGIPGVPAAPPAPPVPAPAPMAPAPMAPPPMAPAPMAPAPFQPPRPPAGPTPPPPMAGGYQPTLVPSGPPAPAPGPAPAVPAAGAEARTMFVPGGGMAPAQAGNFGGGAASARTIAAPSPFTPPAGAGGFPPPAGAGGFPPPAAAPFAPPQPMAPPMAPQPVPYQPQPVQPLPQPLSPYFGVQTAARPGRPIEPWKDSLRLMMLVWGGLMLASFATPTSIEPLTFNWDLILHGEGKQKLPPLIMAGVGLLSIVLALIPTSPLPRGLIAGLLGLTGVAIPIALAGALPPWQVLVPLVGGLVLIPGLIVRQEYRESLLPRILVTIGVLASLLPFLVPANDTVPLVALFKAALEGGTQDKIAAILQLAFIVILVLSLLAWLPAPATGGALVFAWLLLLWGAVTLLTTLAAAGVIVDALTKTPYAVLSWIPSVCYGVLIGYGFATVIGKRLE